MVVGDRGHEWQGGMHGWGLGMHSGGEGWACMVGRGRAGETATEAGGTHPTGMHSCVT